MSLRGGAAIDDNHTAPQFDAEVDRPAPEYLEKYYWGIPHLDASLRPPDRDPPRFASLTADQW